KALRCHMTRNRRAASTAKIKHSRSLWKKIKEALDIGLINPNRSTAVSIPRQRIALIMVYNLLCSIHRGHSSAVLNRQLVHAPNGSKSTAWDRNRVSHVCFQGTRRPSCFPLRQANWRGAPSAGTLGDLATRYHGHAIGSLPAIGFWHVVMHLDDLGPCARIRK